MIPSRPFAKCERIHSCGSILPYFLLESNQQLCAAVGDAFDVGARLHSFNMTRLAEEARGRVHLDDAQWPCYAPRTEFVWDIE